MEQITKSTFNKADYHPALFTTYKVMKKLAKYALYILLIYFAYEGFMAWE